MHAYNPDRFRFGGSMKPFALLAGVLLLAACARTAPERDAVAAVPPVASDYSLFDIDAAWHDQHDAARTLASLAGKPLVLAMVYTHCTASCPLSVAQMQRIEREVGDDASFVLVTLDPERDTSEQLRSFAAEHDLDPARWTLLRGSEASVRELAAVIGVRYRSIDAGEIAHSNLLTVLDATGAVVHQQEGLGDADATVAVVRALAP
jgi:protein SCO1/2